MGNFQTAFSLWADSTSLKLNHIAELADIHGGDIYRIKTGKKAVTRNIIAKLIPAIATEDSKESAAKLLLAYYQDIAPPGFENDLQINSSISSSDTPLDLLSAALQHHAERARQDSDYAKHIITLFLLGRESDTSKIEDLVNKWHQEKVQASLYELHRIRSHETLVEESEPVVALLSETSGKYKFTPKLTSKFTSGHPQDTNRTDPMPSQHVAQEHNEP